MPIYEYKCEQCGNEFEELVIMADDEPSCPACGREHCKRLLSISRGSANSKGGTGLPRDLSSGFGGGSCGSGGGFN